YDKGVALADADRLADARASLEQALGLATGLDVCPVRTNLGLVIERMGDQARAADPDWAKQLYGEALTITLETPKECRSDEARDESPDPSRDPDQELDDTEQRLREKMQDPPQQDPPPEQDPEEQEPQDDDALGDIEERLQEGQRQRDEQQRQGEEDGGAGSGVEKPGRARPRARVRPAASAATAGRGPRARRRCRRRAAIGTNAGSPTGRSSAISSRPHPGRAGRNRTRSAGSPSADPRCSRSCSACRCSPARRSWCSRAAFSSRGWSAASSARRRASGRGAGSWPPSV